MLEYPIIRLEDYAVSDKNGFLPSTPPIANLPNTYYEPWESLASQLSTLIKDGSIRSLIDNMPILDVDLLLTEPEWQRAYSVLGFLTHAYIWGGTKPKDTIPPCITKPFLKICAHLGLPPCATYAGLTLWNYTARSDADISDPDNLSLLTSFTNTPDEEWFLVISVAIEAKGGKLVTLMLDAIAAASANEVQRLTALLWKFTDGLRDFTSTLQRMHEKCDPSVFFYQLRPFLAGSKNMASAGLPRGVFYDEGNGQGEWRQYSGGSNGQSSLIQTFDIFLGVNHHATGGLSGSSSYLQEMRNYMPDSHKRFLEILGRHCNIRSFVMSSLAEKLLKDAYNDACMTLSAFRDTHMRIVSRYIVLAARRGAPTPPSPDNVNLATASAQVDGLKDENPSGLYGTGGTALMPFLKQTRDTTKDATF
ncbi:Indoleamine 2-3-dioxygenase [Penicillium verhagenii]|uniref:Indoleamine 2-3-dioxygenase n=1 Tax=Penicillium verhagenii TaxID=1562060 RepID=UPI00254597A8|nr:Indoleamine 2-3-dioxygenase [Penicillium verhagenii]KAJ5928109.1 Indoleamine 2-3-dioxygenase [Penicillium verhagenii]